MKRGIYSGSWEVHPPIVPVVVHLEPYMLQLVLETRSAPRNKYHERLVARLVWRSVAHLSDAEENSMAGMTIWCFTTVPLFSRQYTLV